MARPKKRNFVQELQEQINAIRNRVAQLAGAQAMGGMEPGAGTFPTPTAAIQQAGGLEPATMTPFAYTPGALPPASFSRPSGAPPERVSAQVSVRNQTRPRPPAVTALTAYDVNTPVAYRQPVGPGQTVVGQTRRPTLTNPWDVLMAAPVVTSAGGGNSGPGAPLASISQMLTNTNPIAAYVSNLLAGTALPSYMTQPGQAAQSLVRRLTGSAPPRQRVGGKVAPQPPTIGVLPPQELIGAGTAFTPMRPLPAMPRGDAPLPPQELIGAGTPFSLDASSLAQGLWPTYLGAPVVMSAPGSMTPTPSILAPGNAQLAQTLEALRRRGSGLPQSTARPLTGTVGTIPVGATGSIAQGANTTLASQLAGGLEPPVGTFPTPPALIQAAGGMEPPVGTFPLVALPTQLAQTLEALRRRGTGTTAATQNLEQPTYTTYLPQFSLRSQAATTTPPQTMAQGLVPPAPTVPLGPSKRLGAEATAAGSPSIWEMLAGLPVLLGSGLQAVRDYYQSRGMPPTQIYGSTVAPAAAPQTMAQGLTPPTTGTTTARPSVWETITGLPTRLIEDLQALRDYYQSRGMPPTQIYSTTPPPETALGERGIAATKPTDMTWAQWLQAQLDEIRRRGMPPTQVYGSTVAPTASPPQTMAQGLTPPTATVPGRREGGPAIGDMLAGFGVNPSSEDFQTLLKSTPWLAAILGSVLGGAATGTATAPAAAGTGAALSALYSAYSLATDPAQRQTLGQTIQFLLGKGAQGIDWLKRQLGISQYPGLEDLVPKSWQEQQYPAGTPIRTIVDTGQLFAPQTMAQGLTPPVTPTEAQAQGTTPPPEAEPTQQPRGLGARAELAGAIPPSGASVTGEIASTKKKTGGGMAAEKTGGGATGGGTSAETGGGTPAETGGGTTVARTTYLPGTQALAPESIRYEPGKVSAFVPWTAEELAAVTQATVGRPMSPQEFDTWVANFAQQHGGQLPFQVGPFDAANNLLDHLIALGESQRAAASGGAGSEQYRMGNRYMAPSLAPGFFENAYYNRYAAPTYLPGWASQPTEYDVWQQLYPGQVPNLWSPYALYLRQMGVPAWYNLLRRPYYPYAMLRRMEPEMWQTAEVPAATTSLTQPYITVGPFEPSGPLY